MNGRQLSTYPVLQHTHDHVKAGVFFTEEMQPEYMTTIYDLP